MNSLLLLAGLVLGLTSTPALVAGDIMVFAAASLTDSLTETAAAFEKASGERVRFNFAGSNTLVQQIQAGAPVDLFFSADASKMDALQRAGLIVKASRKDLLRNTLVVITPNGGIPLTKPADLASPSVKYLSLANPQAVPAGIYAQKWLESVDLWQNVRTKVAPAENVRAAMAVVESGNAEAGVVYKTDAATSKKVTVAWEIAEADGPKIAYPVALMKDSRNATAAKKFLTWLGEKQASETFRKFGFSVIE
jgi:molybdate transport system substrate-binding protein